MGTFGTLISEGNAKCTFIREHNFGPLSSSPVLFVFSPGKMLLTLSVVQEWLDTRNATVEAHVQLCVDADFIFQQDLAPANSAKATSTWFKDHGIPVLNWPANSPDLNRRWELYQLKHVLRAESKIIGLQIQPMKLKVRRAHKTFVLGIGIVI